jgi:hypothetical protein
VVIDAKWKRIKPGTIRPGDFYQAVAYAIALNAERVVLVYPGGTNAHWNVSLPANAPRVEVRTLRVTVPPTRCRRSLKCLAHSLLSGHM